jgi:hypothetical protein
MVINQSPLPPISNIIVNKCCECLSSVTKLSKCITNNNQVWNYKTN